jgi:hypothetical protein
MGRTRGLESRTAATIGGELYRMRDYLVHLSAELPGTYGKASPAARLVGRASLPSRYRPKRVRCSWSGQIRFMQGGDCWRNSGKQKTDYVTQLWEQLPMCELLLPTSDARYANSHND